MGKNNIGKVLEQDGYKMFRGSLIVTPDPSYRPPFVERGVCLYYPDKDIWSVGIGGYPSSICRIATCEECRHYMDDPVGHVPYCENPDSCMYGDYTDADDSCESWDAR